MAKTSDPQLPTSPQPGVTVAPTKRIASNREEIIQIIPHPTTNRYPWTPVDNPHLPLQKPIVSPIIQTAPRPAATLPQPVAPKSMPVVAKPVASIPAPTPPVVTKPIPPPIQRPLPAPTPPPVIQARPVVVQISQPVSPAATIAREPELTATESTQPAPVIVKALPHIYSESTREVWRVFRPNRVLAVLVIGFIVLVVVGGFILWLDNGKQSVFNLPFLHKQ